MIWTFTIDSLGRFAINCISNDWEKRLCCQAINRSTAVYTLSDCFFVFLNCVWSLVRFVYVSIKLRFERIDGVINVANGLLELIDESDVARTRIPTIPEDRAPGDAVSKGATNAMAVAGAAVLDAAS